MDAPLPAKPWPLERDSYPPATQWPVANKSTIGSEEIRHLQWESHLPGDSLFQFYDFLMQVRKEAQDGFLTKRVDVTLIL